MKPLRTKTCATCRTALPVECFGASTRTRDGLKTLCRECTRDYFREWKIRRIVAHSRWLDEHGLKDRGPGLGAGVRAPSRFFRDRMREG